MQYSLLGELLKAYSDLDLDPTILNIELIRATFIYYNPFQQRCQPGKLENSVKSHIGVLCMPTEAAQWLRGVLKG